MMHPDWNKYSFSENSSEDDTWDNRSRKLWSTDWFKLFLDNDTNSENDDQRSKLTWQNRFKDIFKKDKDINIVQYYSEGEEVLQKATIGAPSGLEGNGPVFGGGRNSWNVSEKAKGDRGVSGALFIGGSRAGWAFKFITSADDPHCEQHWSDLLTDTECLTDIYTKSEAEAITVEEQKTSPFFQPFKDANLLSVEVVTGSNAAKLGHPHLLSYDIPALSFAAGGTKINKPKVLAEGNKVGMNAEFKRDGWPEDHRSKDGTKSAWFHSDFKDVSYLYTSKLYKDMVERGDLK